MGCTSPIGFFDSGLGGISVLRGTRELMPGEDYLYYGDSLHAPYGGKTPEEVQNLAFHAAEQLMNQGCKAMVIACNTATSAAIQALREQYPQTPVVGIEPAVKPAVERHPGGRILVMATVGTLAGEKFAHLIKEHELEAEIVAVPCSGLMEFVERGELEGDRVEQFLLDILSPFVKVPVDAVVLGCTHYPFLKKTLRKLLGHRPELLDGSHGVAQNLCHQLEALNLRNPREQGGTVVFQNSKDDPALLQLSEQLLYTQG